MTSITLPHNIDASPLFLPPNLVPNPTTITRLAVYGTLRDDDDSGASWTSSFIANRTSACSGIVRGAKLYWAHKLNYPCALVTNNTNDHIHVRVMTFGTGEEWTRKLVEADRIEGYDLEAEGRSEYVRRRVIVEVGCEGSGLHVDAWIYVATKLDHFGQVVELPHGDWTRRAETDQWKKNDDTQ